MRSRPKLNRHLFLKDGNWWTRFVRNGEDERRSTGCPRSEIAAARSIRDQRLGEIATRRAGMEAPTEPALLGELIRVYREEESRPYDREKGGEQPGTKRTFDCDRASANRVCSHMDATGSAALIDREALLDFAKAMEREDPIPAPGTRRKTAAFLRRVFSWAIENRKKTGISRSPFAELTRSDRARLFPRNRKRSYLYSADELRALYEQLPAHLVPFVKFAVHSGMRFAEITSLRWGAVNLERKALTVEARFAKNKKERDVALGDVALSILEAIRRPDYSPVDHVFLGRRGKPIESVSGGFNAAVLEVWKPSKPEERRPRFHDLRKTGATRIEAVSSHAVAKTFLGHADENVTDTYIVVTLDAVRDAVNRAARLIDGEASGNVVFFPAHGTLDGTPAVSAGK